MGWFTKKSKSGQNKVDFKLYTDLQFKHHFKLLDYSESITTDELINMIHHQSTGAQYQENDMIYMMVLVVIENDKKDQKKILSQRRLNNFEQPVKICANKQNPSIEHKIYFLEIPQHKLLEMRAYHQNVNAKINIFLGQNHDKYDRFGTLMKKNKHGTFKERNFKLLKDCLLYYHQNKTQRMNYIALDSLTLERSVNTKDKYVFQIRVDQRVYILKANSKTDYEGWIYAIQKQSMQVKETKLFSDYDKKVALVQKQRMDHYKNLTSSASSGIKQMILQTPEVASDFVKFLKKTLNNNDWLLLDIIMEAIKQKAKSVEPNKSSCIDQKLKEYLIDFSSGNFSQFLSQKSSSDHQKITNLTSHILNGLNSVDDVNQVQTILVQYGIQYLEQNHIGKFKSTQSQKVSLCRLPVLRFNNYMKFGLPNFQLFWTDYYLEETPRLLSSQNTLKNN